MKGTEKWLFGNTDFCLFYISNVDLSVSVSLNCLKGENSSIYFKIIEVWDIHNKKIN